MTRGRASLVAEDRERSTADVTAALRGERKYLTDFRVRRRDGAVRILRGEGQVIRDASGRAVRMVGINWDVTDLVTAERQREELLAELRQHQEQLEALVASRTVELQRANQELGASFESLRSLEKLRDDLVHMIVHDKVTPLTAVLARLYAISSRPRRSAQVPARISTWPSTRWFRSPRCRTTCWTSAAWKQAGCPSHFRFAISRASRTRCVRVCVPPIPSASSRSKLPLPWRSVATQRSSVESS
jgi:hypothetical protein